jgi:CheY-like chemotaxis protein
MAIEFDILSPSDRPALLGIAAPDLQDYIRQIFEQLGFKVHAAGSPDEFLERFGRIQYEMVLLEDNFGGATLADNTALATLQNMPMMHRRHATILLLGDSFQTLDPMQAFQQSVHAVINRMDIDKLTPILQQALSDNTVFLQTYRDVQSRIVQGKK